MTRTVDDLLRKNLDAFGERDATKRRAIMSTLWAANGVLIDPEGPHVGPHAIDEVIDRLLLNFPDFVLTELGPPNSHNGIGRLAWGFGPPGEKPVVTGLDVMVTNADRIQAFYTFVDPPSSETSLK
jgi:hypothetical protein